MGLLNLAVAGFGLIQGQQQSKQARKAAKQADPFAPLRPGFQDILSRIYGLPSTADKAAQARTPLGQMETRLEKLKNLQGRNIYGTRGNRTDYTSQIADLESKIAEAKADAPAPAPQQGAFANDFFSNLPGLQFAIQQGTQAAQRRASASGAGRSGNLLAEIAAYVQGLASQRAGEEIDRIARFSGAGTGPETAANIRANAPSPLSGMGSALSLFGGLPSAAPSATSVTPA